MNRNRKPAGKPALAAETSAYFVADMIAGYDDYIRGRVTGDGGGSGVDRTSIDRLQELVAGKKDAINGIAETRSRGRGYRVGIELAQAHRRLAQAGAANAHGELLVEAGQFGALVQNGEEADVSDLTYQTMAKGAEEVSGGLIDSSSADSWTGAAMSYLTTEDW